MKICLIIAGFVSLCISFVLGYLGKNSAMTVAFLGFLALFVFAFLDKVKEFSITLSGLKARMQEAQKEVGEAKASIEDLRLITKVVGKATMSLVARIGKAGGSFEDKERDEIIKSVQMALKRIVLPEDDVEDVLAEVYRSTEFDYVGYVLGGRFIPDNIPPEAASVWEDLRNRGVDRRPNPDAVKAFLVKYDFLDDDVRERLEDYKYYVANREHRRPEQWAKRHEVAPLKTLS